jgi:hypothetical protein
MMIGESSTSQAPRSSYKSRHTVASNSSMDPDSEMVDVATLANNALSKWAAGSQARTPDQTQLNAYSSTNKTGYSLGRHRKSQTTNSVSLIQNDRRVGQEAEDMEMQGNSLAHADMADVQLGEESQKENAPVQRSGHSGISYADTQKRPVIHYNGDAITTEEPIVLEINKSISQTRGNKHAVFTIDHPHNQNHEKLTTIISPANTPRAVGDLDLIVSNQNNENPSLTMASASRSRVENSQFIPFNSENNANLDPTESGNNSQESRKRALSSNNQAYANLVLVEAASSGTGDENNHAISLSNASTMTDHPFLVGNRTLTGSPLLVNNGGVMEALSINNNQEPGSKSTRDVLFGDSARQRRSLAPTASSQSFVLSDYKLENTLLLITLNTNEYGLVPIKLRSCPTMAEFFTLMLRAWDLEGREEQVMAVAVQVPWEGTDKVIVVKKNLADTFEVMMEKIDGAPCWAAGTVCEVAVKIILQE